MVCGAERGRAAQSGGGRERETVIRQAISCDICGTEKRQTNHWFVAYEQGAELRVSGWSTCNRQRPGMKHLCGQTCLHKLVDDFMARTIAVRPQTATMDEAQEETPATTDTSLTNSATDMEFESSARLIERPELAPQRVTAQLVNMPARPRVEPVSLPAGEPRYASRDWRAEAWQRERERTQCITAGRRPEMHRLTRG